MQALVGGDATVYRGPEGVREMIRDFYDTFADVHLEVLETRESGDRVGRSTPLSEQHSKRPGCGSSPSVIARPAIRRTAPRRPRSRSRSLARKITSPPDARRPRIPFRGRISPRLDRGNPSAPPTQCLDGAAALIPSRTPVANTPWPFSGGPTLSTMSSNSPRAARPGRAPSPSRAGEVKDASTASRMRPEIDRSSDTAVPAGAPRAGPRSRPGRSCRGACSTASPSR